MKNIFLILLGILVISCGKSKQDKEDEKKAKPLLSLVKEHAATKSVKKHFLNDVATWNELKVIDSFFVKFKKISPNEALSNALELRDLVKNLKDSVKPEIFETPSLNARINILYNESLRLADLTLISAIKAKEINEQVDKTIQAFSDLNTKINTVLSKKRFEDEITIDASYIGLDTTKIDSVSKKTINQKIKSDLEKKNKRFERYKPKEFKNKLKERKQ